MSDDNIYFSSCSFKSTNLKDLLVEARSLGISNVELSGGINYVDGDRDLLIRESHHFNFILHNYCFNIEKPFLLNLAADDLDEQNFVIEYVKSLCELSSAIGQNTYSLHWGYALKTIFTSIGDSKQFQQNTIPLENAKINFFRALDVLLPFFLEHNVQLLVENNSFSFFDGVKRENNICLGVGLIDMHEITSMYDSDCFGLLVDLAHAAVCENTLGAEILNGVWPSRRVKWLHLSRPSQFIDSNLPLIFDKRYKERVLNFAGGVTIEVNYSESLDYDEQLHLVRSMLNG